ncbi:MAG: heme exporter protein CcmB [Wolbachia endosymbiont of Fragariocoptes setiger]|nr:heme exporter protein CcmB [Wolbachia endosymbiont of Fragariocoptes setiger]
MVSLLKKINMLDLVNTTCLFVIMISLSSFALEESKKDTVLIVMWICSTLVLQISTNNLFTSDYNSGILEQIFIQPSSTLKFIIVYKIFLHWISFGLSISIISFIFNIVILESSLQNAIRVGLSLLANSLTIISLSITGSALTIGKGSGISSILVLPMIMPTFAYFRILTQQSLSIQLLFIVFLISTILIINSTIATYTALKFAVEHD